MSQVIKMESSISQLNRIQPQHYQEYDGYNNDYNNDKNRRCTCEMGKIKAKGKSSFCYSLCDVCSERLFCN